jgi:hypothetical protein
MIMMHDKKTTQRLGLIGLLIGCSVGAGGAATKVAAQESQTKTAVTRQRPESVGRDPFKKYEPPHVVVKRLGGQVLPPSIQARIAQYRAQKIAAMNARMQAPKPTTALLLGEVQVVGISRTPRGYAAIVEATPIRMSFVIYPGEAFYDGQLVAIEDHRLVFRHETVFTDGRRERSVELKPLRQAAPIDSMTAAGTPTAASPEPDAQKKGDDKPIAADKP